MDNKTVLEDILVAQVLTLAQAKKNEAKINGRQTSDDFIHDACRDVVNKRERVLQLLDQQKKH